METDENPWIVVHSSHNDTTEYMVVDGGRIYKATRSAFNEGESDSIAMVFVPGVKH